MREQNIGGRKTNMGKWENLTAFYSLSILSGTSRGGWTAIFRKPGPGLEWFPEKRALNAPIRDLTAWKQTVDGIGSPVHLAAYMFVLLTGLSRSEIENLEWDRVSDELYFPPTKAGREFWLPLTDAHHRILLSVRGIDPRWVFPPYGKTGHIVCWDHKHVPGTFHSLRHTFATVAVEAGVPEEVVGRLLNHSSKTITGQRYVKPKLDSYDLPCGSPLTRWKFDYKAISPSRRE